MRYRAVLLIVCTSGCNRLLGLDETALIDAAPGTTADALPATCSTTLPLEPFAVTHLIDDTVRGKDAEVVTGPTQPALFSYAIDGFLDGGKHIAAAVLQVAPITRCGVSACTPCPTGATRYQLYWNNEDWDEPETTSIQRDSNSPWERPFAEGATDRSAQIFEDALPTGAQLALRAPMAEVAGVPAAPWIATHDAFPRMRISLQLRTDAPAAFASDDHDESLCGETAAPPSLVLTICE